MDSKKQLQQHALVKHEPEVDHVMEDDPTPQRLTQGTREVPRRRRKPFVQGLRQSTGSSAHFFLCQYDDSFGDDAESSVDHAVLSDNSHGSGSGDVKLCIPRNRLQNGKRPRKSRGGSEGNSTIRPKRMYELDVTLYPEAAAARASYENRRRRKAEKEEMINQLNFLIERNQVLEQENAALKEKLLEYDSNVTAQDWFLFFRAAGIRSGDDRKYASIFYANRIKPSLLLDLNEQWLRDMKISAVGDILAILKQAKLVHSQTNGRKIHFSSPPNRSAGRSASVTNRSSDSIQITAVCSLNNTQGRNGRNRVRPLDKWGSKWTDKSLDGQN